MDRVFIAAAALVAALGAIGDIRTGRIPNRLTYAGVVSALAVRLLALGWAGLQGGLVALALCGGAFFLLFLLRGIGGGDVKLMAAVGAWAGSEQAAQLLIATVLAGGLLAVGAMVFHKRVGATLTNTLELLRHFSVSGFQPHPILNVQESGSMRVPYGAAIAMGALFCLGRSISRG